MARKLRKNVHNWLAQDEDIQALKRLKPSQPALEQAKFYLSLFKQQKLLQQG